eukprot:COSAG05_NODE_28189_length_131_cov_45.250000_1_plen_35_part_10
MHDWETHTSTMRAYETVEKPCMTGKHLHYLFAPTK